MKTKIVWSQCWCGEAYSHAEDISPRPKQCPNCDFEEERCERLYIEYDLDLDYGEGILAGLKKEKEQR